MSEVVLDPVKPAVSSTEVLHSPILRFGFLFTGLVDGGRIAFHRSKTVPGIDALVAREAEMLAIVTKWFEGNGWSVDVNAPGLSGVKTVRRLGAVVDLSEILISRGDEHHVIRLSFTVCVDKRSEIEEHVPKADFNSEHGVYLMADDAPLTLYSKIWVRTASVSLNESGVFEQKDDAHLKFADEFEDISAALIQAVAPVYETILRELSGGAFGEVKLSKREAVSNLMLSVEHESLRDMYHAIRNNEFQVENCGTLSSTEYFTFYDKMFDHLNLKVENKDYEVGCKKLYASKAEDIRGVCVVQVTDEITRIYGAAHALFWSPRDAKSKTSLVHWRESPGLTLGAIMMTGLASRY